MNRNFWEKAFALALAVLVCLWIYCLTRPREPEIVPEPAPDAQPVQIVQRVVEAEPEPVNEAPEPAKMPQIENATLSHYCCCKICTDKTPADEDYGITASGRPVEPYYSVAVDPFLIPLGSTVYIDYGDGVLHECRADDTGSKIAGAKIDLYIPDHDEAWDRGIKTVRVYWKEGI